MSTTQIQEAVRDERTRCVKIVEQIRDAYGEDDPMGICNAILKEILGTASLPSGEEKTP